MLTADIVQPPETCDQQSAMAHHGRLAHHSANLAVNPTPNQPARPRRAARRVAARNADAVRVGDPPDLVAFTPRKPGPRCRASGPAGSAGVSAAPGRERRPLREFYARAEGGEGACRSTSIAAPAAATSSRRWWECPTPTGPRAPPAGARRHAGSSA